MFADAPIRVTAHRMPTHARTHTQTPNATPSPAHYPVHHPTHDRPLVHVWEEDDEDDMEEEWETYDDLDTDELLYSSADDDDDVIPNASTSRHRIILSPEISSVVAEERALYSSIRASLMNTMQSLQQATQHHPYQAAQSHQPDPNLSLSSIHASLSVSGRPYHP